MSHPAIPSVAIAKRHLILKRFSKVAFRLTFFYVMKILKKLFYELARNLNTKEKKSTDTWISKREERSSASRNNPEQFTLMFFSRDIFSSEEKKKNGLLGSARCVSDIVKRVAFSEIEFHLSSLLFVSFSSILNKK